MQGRILSIFAFKGGSGATFVSVNLAAFLASETGKNVLLIDCSTPLPMDAGMFLGIEHPRSFQDIMKTAEELEPAIIKSYIGSGTHGVSLLNAEYRSGNGTPDSIHRNGLETVLKRLKSTYDYMVFDLGSTWTVCTETMIDLSDLLLLPMTPDYLSIHKTRKGRGVLREMNYPEKNVIPVVNFDGANGVRKSANISELFGMDVDLRVPFDKDSGSHLSRGPYTAVLPDHPVTRSFQRIGMRVLEKFHGLSNGTEEAKEEKVPDVQALKMFILKRIHESPELKKIQTEVEDDPEKLRELKSRLRQNAAKTMDRELLIDSRELRDLLMKEILEETIGFGPLEDLLNDPEVKEIMVVRWDEIYVERNRGIEHSSKQFLSESHLMRIIQKIVSPIGRKIDTSTPMVDARLKDGSRVNAIIPPLAVGGATLTIRKFPEKAIGFQELFGFGSLNEQMAAFLKAAVKGRLNILVSGGTGTGKTTLLNALSSEIPEVERIITIEDSAELRLQQRHVITLEARPANIEGKGEVKIRDLLKNSLRMRPDRIVLGECRGEEALDVLAAMNTGHDGSLTTIHANTSRDALSRLETYVGFAGLDLPSKAIREQIAGAIDIIVQLKRFKDGSRKIIQISEVGDMVGDEIQVDDVIVFRQYGEAFDQVNGEFVPTGIRPERALKRFRERGITIPGEIFWNDSGVKNDSNSFSMGETL